MGKDQELPQWLQNAIGIVLASAVAILIGAVWTDRVDNARRDERIIQLEDDLSRFREPGARYTATDGRRDRAECRELKEEFNAFREKGSRAIPMIARLQLQVDQNRKQTQQNKNGWYDCSAKHERLIARFDSDLYFIRKALDINGQD